MKKLLPILALLIVVVMVSLGCSKESQAEKDEETIVNYLTTNNLFSQAEKDGSGLYFIIDDAGDVNNRPTLTQNVVVRYEGLLIDGTVFDAVGPGDSLIFPLANLIAGWQIGLQKIGAGGSIRLFVPSGLGYGDRRVGNIPANSVLIFSIDLLDVFTQSERDEQLIVDFLMTNDLLDQAVRDPSGLYYIIDDAGTPGTNPVGSSFIELNYTGTLLNGTIFDQSGAGTPAMFQLGSLIQGWQIGLPKIGEEGEIRLFIPSALGYGNIRTGAIPPNSVLLFDIELLEVS